MIDGGTAIALDGDGNVFVTGVVRGPVDFGGGRLGGGFLPAVFVVKFDANGDHLWSQIFGDSGARGQGIAVDGAGNVLVAGEFLGTVDFGGGSLISAGSFDIFVAKFDPSGTPLWSKRFGDIDSDRGWGIAVDGTENVVVTGEFEGTVNFGDGSLVGAGKAATGVGVLRWTGPETFS
jgi:hypothetical protein